MRPPLSPIASVLLLAACAEADGQQLYVLPAEDGEWDDPAGMASADKSMFTTIQAAVNAASSGDTVNIPSGTYTESVRMKDGVNVVGAGQAETKIVGGITFTGLSSATLSDVSLYDRIYTTTGTKYSGVGIYVDGGNATIEDVSAYYYNYGIFAYNAGSVSITRVYVHDDKTGVAAQGTDNLELSNSLVHANPSAGFTAELGTSGRVVHNTFIGNGFGTSGSYLVGAIALGKLDDPVIANNILVSNDDGLNCWSCKATWGHNLVWGNTTNYINDASAAATDLSADPAFAGFAEGDYGLSAASVAIDAGDASYGISTDADGESRPQGAGYDIGMDEYTVSTYTLVITEVMANAKTESTGEFIELYNAGSADVDLDGFQLSDGDATDSIVAFGSSSTRLAPGARAVVLDADYAGGYTIPAGVTLLTTDDTTIGNGLTTSDEVTLYESDGSTIVARFSAPSDPGDGVSKEMVDLELGDVAANWLASQCASGSSPGDAACFAEAGDASGLVLTEILANPLSEATGEYVELYNPTAGDIELDGLVLSDGASSDTIVSYGGGSTLLGPGEHALVLDSGFVWDHILPADVVLMSAGSTLGNGLATTDTITLYAADGTTRIDSFSSPTNPGDGVSIEKVDYAAGDVPANWARATATCTSGSSPGRLNGAAGGACGALVITEVMANADDEDTEEFVEIYNAGADTIDLAGLVLSDGDGDDTLRSFDGGATTLAPGGWAIIVDAEFAGGFTPAAGAVVVTTGDTTVGNGLATTDPITLYEADGLTPIDHFGWPTNPGNATSIERLAWTGVLDSAASWVASTCAAGASPGGANCAASESGATAESSAAVLITEIMANADSESTGEFIELYNAGSTDVDLAGWVVFDGDATDTLQGFSDPLDTVLVAGGWAVILDADFTTEYTSIPADTLLLRTDDSTVCSGLATDDPITVYEADASSLVDSFSFPTNPGNAVSIERIELAGDDVESNWRASTCPSGSSPGEATCP